jgi:transposase
MADQETWAKRVAEWKASGLTSAVFCEGKDFTPGGLRYMAHRLGGGRQQGRPSVRIARVARQSRARPSSQVETSPVASVPAVVVELGAARVMVRPGADRATLAAVVEVLAALTGVAR